MAIPRNILICSFSGKFNTITSNICPKTKEDVTFLKCKECELCVKTIVPSCSSCYIKVWCSYIPEPTGNINIEG